MEFTITMLTDHKIANQNEYMKIKKGTKDRKMEQAKPLLHV